MAGQLESSAPDLNPDWWIGSYSTFKKMGTKEEDYGLRSSDSNRHTYLVDESGKKRVISRAAFRDRMETLTDRVDPDIPKQDDAPEQHHSGDFETVDIRMLARNARRARELGDKTTQLALEDEIQERIIQHAEQGGWDNETTDAALEYFIDIIYNTGALPPDFVIKIVSGDTFDVHDGDGADSGIPVGDFAATPDVGDSEESGDSDSEPPFIGPMPPTVEPGVGDPADSDDPESDSVSELLVIPLPVRGGAGPDDPTDDRMFSTDVKGEKKKRLSGRLRKILGGLGIVATLGAILVAGEDRTLKGIKHELLMSSGTPASTLEVSSSPVADDPIADLIEVTETATPADTETPAPIVPAPTEVAELASASTPEETGSEGTPGSTSMGSTSTEEPEVVNTVETPSEAPSSPTIQPQEAAGIEAAGSESGDMHDGTAGPAGTSGGETSPGNTGETTTLSPDDESTASEDITSETPRGEISATVPENGGITHMLQQYMTQEKGISLEPEQLYALYKYLVSNYDITKLFTDVTFITLPNGDIGIADPGPVNVTPAGQDAIDMWLDENVRSRS